MDAANDERAARKAAEAESEGRVALVAVGEERAAEWRRAEAAEARVAALESALRAFNDAFMLIDGALVCDCGPHLDGPCGVCVLSDAHDKARRVMEVSNA